jgi:hypothetical protein
LFVSRTRPTVRKRCDWKYFLGDLRRLFFFGYQKSWPEVPILFQNLRSELFYTFKWTKSVARLWMNFEREKKSPYLPTHRWNGGSGVGNEHIFFLRLDFHNLFDHTFHMLNIQIRNRCGRNRMVVGFICIQCLLPPKLWVQTALRRGVLDTTLCDKVC